MENSSTEKAGHVRAARRFSINAASLLFGDVLNRGASFLIYALVARYCGTHSFGQLSLGLMLLYSFQVIASVGMPTLIVRDVAKYPKLDSQYLVHASAIVFGGFAVSYAVLGLLVFFFGYAADTSQVILLLGVSILPSSLSLNIEALFRAKERMHLILWAAIPVQLAKLGLAFYLLTLGFGVSAIAMVLLLAHISIFLIQLGILLPILQSRLPRWSWKFCRTLYLDSWKFCGIDVLVALWASLNYVLLSWCFDETAVGIFGAAIQLLNPPSIALQAVVNSLFPTMCRHAEQGREKSYALIVMMFEVLTFFALPGCVLLWYCAAPLIELVYSQNGFDDSAILVRIMLLSLIFGAMTRLLGQLLLSYLQEHVNLRIVALDFLFNLICGAILIPLFGVFGAAITVLLTSLVDFVLHLLATFSLLADESRSRGGPKLMIFWWTLASTGVMAATFEAMGDASFIWTVTAATTMFLTTFIVLCFWSNTGPHAFRERFWVPLSD